MFKFNSVLFFENVIEWAADWPSDKLTSSDASAFLSKFLLYDVYGIITALGKGIFIEGADFTPS